MGQLPVWRLQTAPFLPPCRSQLKDFLGYVLAAFLLRWAAHWCRCPGDALYPRKRHLLAALPALARIPCQPAGDLPASTASRTSFSSPLPPCSWSAQLRQLEFQDLIMFLQKPPTSGWTEKDVELVLSRAFMWRASFKGAASHFA